MALIINGERIEDSMIQRQIERFRSRHEQDFSKMNPEEREAQLRQWSKDTVIENILVRQHVRKTSQMAPHSQIEYILAKLKQKYEDQEQFLKDVKAESEQEVIESIELTLAMGQQYNEIAGNLPKPTQADIEKFYRENAELFMAGERVRVAHIVKYVDWRSDEAAAFEAITKAQEELKRGVPFEVVVRRHTDCADPGGDLGYIERGEMVEEFDDVVFNLSVGQVSDIFRTRFGYHIAKLYDRRPPSIPPLEEVKTEVLAELNEQRRSEAIYGFLDQLRSQAKIEEV